MTIIRHEEITKIAVKTAGEKYRCNVCGNEMV